MIELTQVKSTDKLGQLQGILNTAFNEIQTDQPFVGLCQNISADFYYAGTLTATVTASMLTASKLYALCLPENNGVYVVKVFGRVMFDSGTIPDATRFDQIVIDIPAVKLATRNAAVSTFVAPSHLGLADADTIYAGAVIGDFPTDGRIGPNVDHGEVTIKASGNSCDVTCTGDFAGIEIAQDYALYF